MVLPFDCGGVTTDACIKRRTLYRWWPTYSVAWIYSVLICPFRMHTPSKLNMQPETEIFSQKLGISSSILDSSRSFSSVSCLPFLQDPCMHPYRELTYWYFWYYIESLNPIHAGHALMWICDEGGELTSTLQVNLHLNPWPLRILRSCHPFCVRDP